MKRFFMVGPLVKESGDSRSVIWAGSEWCEIQYGFDAQGAHSQGLRQIGFVKQEVKLPPPGTWTGSGILENQLRRERS
ncbi:hypothetical protein NBRC116588_18600 [Pyruvatibacter sp. HU-CL02332]